MSALDNGFNAIADQIGLLVEALQRPANFIQFVVGLVAFGLGLFITRRFKRGVDKSTVRGRLVTALAFPFSVMVLLEIGRAILHRFGVNTFAISIAVELAFAALLLRLIGLILRRVFPSKTWLTITERYIATIVWIAVALDQVGLLTDIIGWMDELRIHIGKQEVSLWVLIQGVLTIGVTMIVAMWLSRLIEDRLQSAQNMDSSVRAVLVRLIKALLTFLGLLISMSLVGLDFTALSVFSGALGIGLGFGLQKIASSYVAGFIILLDRSIRIGNLIGVGSERGEVQEITTRYTVLKTLSGINIIVPNETLIGSIVQNETFIDPNVSISIRVQVSYNTDVEKALVVLRDCALVHERVLRDPPPSTSLANFGESGIDLDLWFWLYDPRQGAGGVKSAINREIWRRFKEEGIEFPYPQREVRILNPSLPLAPSAEPAPQK
jgi:small-conductance mechanosensitive channel